MSSPLSASSAAATPATYTGRRRGRPPASHSAAGMADGPGAENALTSFEERLKQDVLAGMGRAPGAAFNPELPKERERLVLCMSCQLREQVAWALGTFNALTYEAKRSCYLREYPGLLDALVGLLDQYLEDVEHRRSKGLRPDEEMRRMGGACAVAVGSVRVDGASGAPLVETRRQASANPSLQQYDPELFNVRDPVSSELEDRALVVSNILRNLSFVERNGAALAEHRGLHDTLSALALQSRVVLELRENALDVWLHISSILNVAEGAAAEPVLRAAITLLDPFLPGADHFANAFPKAAELIARLAANPDNNEDVITAHFPTVLPRLVDLLGGKDRRCVAAGVAALCNVSSFDWPARSKVARTPRGVGRMVAMLRDHELAPRASLALHNLAESPNNRGVLMSYERELVERAMEPSPACDTVASILFELTAD